MSDNLKFIVTVTNHRHLGDIFVPYLAEVHPTCYIVNSLIRQKEISRKEYPFNDREKEIVRLTSKYADSSLALKFSRQAATLDFFNSVDKDYLQSTVIPYVKKLMYKVALLLMEGGIALHEKDGKYSNIYEEDRIAVSGSFARALFAFTRHDAGTDYELRISQDGDSVRLVNRNVKVITHNPCSIIVRNRLLVFSDIDSLKIQPFFQKEVIKIQKEMEEKYFRHFITQMVKEHEVEARGFTIISRNEIPVPVMCLEPDLGFRPIIVLRMRYGDNEFSLQDVRKSLVISNFENQEYSFVKAERNPEFEKVKAAKLASLGLKDNGGTFTLPNVDLLDGGAAWHSMVSWLSKNREILTGEGFVIRQHQSGKEYFLGKQELHFEVRKTNDWFDLFAMAHFGDYQIPFIRLRKYLLNNVREFELPNGETAILPEEWFTRYKSWVPFARGEGAILSFHRHHFHFLRQGLGQIDSETTEELAQKFEASQDVSVPESLKATLRKYQVRGFQWMHTLHANGLGGCLADDMGLGKTLQTIALLLKLKKLRKMAPSSHPALTSGQLSLFDTVGMLSEWPASLIVMPTSLVHNWSNELARFAPSLHVYRHVGSQRSQSQDFALIVQRYDVILTSYGILRNDADTLKNYEFHCLILDESQYVKNPGSKTYRAVMEMKARHRMALTGTPIENSLSDLWAQMNFLNKGLLGSYQFFRQNFLVPIEQHAEEEVEARLQSLIRPFILRRTKAEVAEDLPPVMEQTIYCPMAETQFKAYEAEKSVIRNAILAKMDNEGIEKSSLIILQGLTRLRQLANHPELLDREESAESGKFTEIFNYLESILAENHKVLIFSSFVTHLELLRNKLEADGRKYCLLTGRTPNREEVIKSFQENPENRVFLISIKAGGVGLNLTDADYVFIIDPWWNPAVENQAVSRAHRIGQKKHVFVYRFITEDSIEQKIEMLKERKSSLADKFINSNNPFRQVTRDDILSLLN